jgi:hypothetical protein
MHMKKCEEEFRPAEISPGFSAPGCSFLWEYPEAFRSEEILKWKDAPVLHRDNQVTLFALGDDAVMVFVHTPPPNGISDLHFFSSGLG